MQNPVSKSKVQGAGQQNAPFYKKMLEFILSISVFLITIAIIWSRKTAQNMVRNIFLIASGAIVIFILIILLVKGFNFLVDNVFSKVIWPMWILIGIGLLDHLMGGTMIKDDIDDLKKMVKKKDKKSD